MAEIKDLQAALETLKKLKQESSDTSSVTDALDALAIKYNFTALEVDRLSSALGIVNTNAIQSATGLKIGKTTLADYSSSAKSTTFDLKNLAASVMGVAAATKLGLPGHPFIDMGRDTQNLSNNINTTTKKVFDFAKEVGLSLPESLEKTIVKISASAEAGKQMEYNLVELAAATGRLSNVVGVTGEHLDRLPSKSAAWAEATRKISSATGVADELVSAYAVTLGKTIPGALDDFSKPTVIAGKTVTWLQAAMQVARGTGQTYETVIREIGESYTNLGIRGTPSLELIARIGAVTEATGLPLDMINKYTMEAAKSFNMYADSMEHAAEQGQGALNIIAKIGPALAQSGLGPAGISEIVRNMTDGISRMNTAQKSFLSAQTGGPGGLQGAFQIDQMISEGKIDQVFDKVRQNMMQKLGGPIVTRAQAASSPEMASQYQRQLMFMQSPAMGGIAKSDAMAAKLLDAMAAGKAAPKEVVSKDRALENAMQRGNALQQRGNTVLTNIASWESYWQKMGAIQNAQLARDLVGERSPHGSVVARREREHDVARGATASPLDGSEGKTPKQIMRNMSLEKTVNKLVADLSQYGNNAVSVGKDIASGRQHKAPTVHPATIPSTHAQMVAHAVDQTKPITSATVPTQQQHGQVNVAVTTVCAQCQRKIALEEAQKAIANDHDHGMYKKYVGSSL